MSSNNDHAPKGKPGDKRTNKKPHRIIQARWAEQPGAKKNNNGQRKGADPSMIASSSGIVAEPRREGSSTSGSSSYVSAATSSVPLGSAHGHPKGQHSSKFSGGGNGNRPDSRPENLFAGFTDPIVVLNRWLDVTEPTLLIQELSNGWQTFKGEEVSNLKTLQKYFEWHSSAKQVATGVTIARLLIKLLGRESFLNATQAEAVNQILQTALNSPLVAVDGPHAVSFLRLLFESAYKDNEFSEDFARLCSTWLTRFPDASILRLHRIFLAIRATSSSAMLPSSLNAVIERFNAMKKHWDETGILPKAEKKTFDNKPKARGAKPARMGFADDPAPNDHALKESRASSLPTDQEMQNLEHDLPVRTNPILNLETSGSVAEYLDTQWRLLRSDALEDIRHGIHALRDAKARHQTAVAAALQKKQPAPPFVYPRSTSYYAYTNVHVTSFADAPKGCSRNELNFHISFEIAGRSPAAKPMDWTRSRRFMPGSLLVLSHDNFQTLIWGTVAQRDEKELAKKILLVSLSIADLPKLDSAVAYEMLETRAYWTSYQHVLDRYATFYKDESLFPLPNFIVGQNAEGNAHRFPGAWHLKNITIGEDHVKSIHLERYLDKTDAALRGGAYFDDAPAPPQPAGGLGMYLAGMMGNLNPFGAQQQREVPDDPAYPKDITILDPSQWSAMKMMLTQRVSLIQGPPGTGKTFLGLRATRILLQQGGFAGPILCVCYTNHALDQFLEGILEFEQKIVRIGGRSRSEKLADYNLAGMLPRLPRSKAIARKCYEREVKRKEIREVYTRLTRPHMAIAKFFEEMGFLADHQTLESNIALLMRLLDIQYVMPYVPSNAAAPAPVIQQNPNPIYLDDSDSDVDEDELAELLGDRLNDKKGDYTNEEADDQDEIKDDPMMSAKARAARPSSAAAAWIRENGTWVGLENACRGAPIDSIGFDANWRVHSRESFEALSLRVRCILFRTFLHEYRASLSEKVQQEMQDFRTLVKEITDFEAGAKVDFLSKQRVIGMTTTGAAKQASMLQALGARVVIIEEAAEIFEAHAVSCLSSSVEKLILIGDHQQLRPKVTYFPLTKRGLDISLFERLIKAGMPHVTLRQQHRMHPEISRYIRPIYPNLIDGPRTLDRADISKEGILNRVVFFAHNWPERGGGNEEDVASSKSNVREALFAFGLVRYLLAQNVDPLRINVIAMYQGQNMLLRSMFRGSSGGVSEGVFGRPDEFLSNKFKAIRVCCVDDYQGEENDIIIVSLVRSNADGAIGFVRIPNRICVSLSRARSAMYVLGSADTIRADARKMEQRQKGGNASSEAPIWPPILQLLETNESLKDNIPIQCPAHPETQKTMKEPEDWAKSLTSCTKPCATQLDCGHWCEQSCHAKLPHRPCTKPCEKIFSACGHKCTELCFEDHPICLTQVPVRMPICNHENIVPCGLRQNAKCTTPCERLLPCGHACPKECSQQCDPKSCSVVVASVTLPSCGHVVHNVSCYDSTHLALFEKQKKHPCGAKLDCGHTCRSDDCSACRRNGSHLPCQEKCGRNRPCAHQCKDKCSEPCGPCKAQCEIRCAHGGCRFQCYKRCNPCMDKCKWKCPHKECTQSCSDLCDREPCDEPCQKKLKCGHLCMGLCGEECPPLCRICDLDKEVWSPDSFHTTLKNAEESVPDARYVYLSRCKHTISVESMDIWMKVQSEESAAIALQRCPQCKTPITNTFGRYSNLIKKRLSLLDEIRSIYAKEEIRRKYKDGKFKEVQEAIEKLLNAKPMGHSMDPPPRDISMLVILAAVRMKTGADEVTMVEPLINEVLSRDPTNQDAKEIQKALISKAMPAIVAALGTEIRSGAWYKCKNGHPYVIGECGGAMQLAKCHCGATIGGTNHQLHADNQHAGVDGSLHAAWGDQANMGNYDLNDIPDE